VSGLFLLTVAGAALAVTGVVRLLRGHPVIPKRRASTGRRRRWWRHRHAVGSAAAAGAVVLAVTRWPAAALATAGLVALWPRVFGGTAAGRRELAKIEAIAAWTESLRDTAGAAAGLEQAIPATVASAPQLLRPALSDLTARLAGRVPLPEALARFADDVADPAADMVVAALSLNARQRAGGLERILTALAATARSELEMRRKVELERRGLRRQAQRIAGAVVGFVILQAMFARGWVAPYSTPAGQLVLTVLIGIFLAAFIRMRSLSNPVTQPRFLTSSDAVTEIASYKPDPAFTGPHIARRGRP
jgi:tight adherence protein B